MNPFAPAEVEEEVLGPYGRFRSKVTDLMSHVPLRTRITALVMIAVGVSVALASVAAWVTVRNQILLLLGSKNVADVSSRAGKEQLAAEIVVATNKTLEGTGAEHAIEGINFTHLIIQ